MKNESYWQIHSDWINALHSLFLKNDGLLTELSFPISHLSPEIVLRLKETIEFDIIPNEEDKRNVQSCIENLEIYNKFMAMVELSIKDGALCENLHLDELLLMNKDRLSKMTKNETDFLIKHIEDVKVKFNVCYNIKDDKQSLILALRSQNRCSAQVLEKLYLAAEQPSEYRHVMEFTQKLVKEISDQKGERIKIELNKFYGKLNECFKTEDNLPELIIDCIQNGICSHKSIIKKALKSIMFYFK